MHGRELKIEFIDLIMQEQAKRCINLTDSIKRKLSQSKEGFKREHVFDNRKIIIDVRWNKEKFVFECSIVMFNKQKDGDMEVFCKI